jgi:signal transduction histidine kinase
MVEILGVESLTDEKISILKRFSRLFEQTYTRFLDIQKAEAQAREAKIETALERVRSKAMAMNSSEDLTQTADTFFSELVKLNINPHRCGLGIVDRETRIADVHATTATQDKLLKIVTGKLKLYGHPVLEKIFEGYEKQEEYHPVLQGKEISEYYEVMNPQVEFPDFSDDEIQYGYYFYFKEGGVFAWTDKEFTESELEIFRRYTSVLSLTYKRYMDLKEAETQAREAQIEAALEKVRARTMAMQSSDELAETAYELYQQFGLLGEGPEQLTIGIIDETQMVMEFWLTLGGNQVNRLFRAPIEEPIALKKSYLAWKEKKRSLVIDISGDELKAYYNFFKSLPDYKEYNEFRNSQSTEQRRVIHYAFFSKGFLALASNEPKPTETIQLLERFAGVLEQTYTRFLDLQKAEAQAREAQIEAALERVRSKTMAMHNSQDVGDTVITLFDEVLKLGLDKSIRVGIGILEDTEHMETWSVTSDPNGEVDLKMGLLNMKIHPMLIGLKKAWKSGKTSYSYDYIGDDVSRYYEALNNEPEYSFYIDLDKLPENEYHRSFIYSEGILFSFAPNPISEEAAKVLDRFARVFGQTYRRYRDLLKAEAQAREAIKQASLDRVRGEIASMRTSEDLNRITPIIWRELKALEVPFIRCGVFIVEEDQEKVFVYLTTPEGKSLGVLHLSFDANELTSKTVDHWRKKQIYKVHWNEDEFVGWTKSMMEIGQVQNAETYQGSSTPPESLDLHFVPFTQGMLYVGDVSPLTDEKLNLVKSLSEAFSIAYARYEDFKSLEDAKNKIEITLSELKSAQAQLVHSEKMASLGELTAGIAHEIKNPLNFVNNFSEVSRELLDEMKTELQNTNNEEITELIEDLEKNLIKINQHGNRADSIIKGMLQHSRGSSGEKTLTDINDLLDQYINLAYHGMRAQNKEFNIAIKKEYDKTLKKIHVVPQDISRVFLNIINNACYAAFDKKKKNDHNFSPTLKVSTKNLIERVEIRIEDNGIGIPASVQEQIFNPFFTTKPTGEGTGLGLSLSYDIITKVHGGNIKFESEEGKHTEFIITLPKD